MMNLIITKPFQLLNFNGQDNLSLLEISKQINHSQDDDVTVFLCYKNNKILYRGVFLFYNELKDKFYTLFDLNKKNIEPFNNKNYVLHNKPDIVLVSALNFYANVINIGNHIFKEPIHNFIHYFEELNTLNKLKNF
jgi:hypothetical protein